jgi:molecular chaperone DnaK
MNEADSHIFQTEKQLKDYGEKLSADKKATIETALNELKEAHKAADLDAIEVKLKALNDAWMAASEELYKAMNEQQQAEGGAANAGTENAAGGDNVQDVEFEEVKDDK